MEQPMSLNRYEYVLGNVLNMTDPSGLAAEQDTQLLRQWNACNLTFSLGKTCSTSDDDNQIDQSKTDMWLYPPWGAALTVSCPASLEGVSWTTTHKQHLFNAFSRINDRLLKQTGLSYVAVFGGMEFRHVSNKAPGQDLGYTPNPQSSSASGFLIEWGPQTRKASQARTKTGAYGFDVSGDKGIEQTIVHELGHAFDYRTGRALNTAVGDINLPAITAVGSLQEGFIDKGDNTEKTADHFLNWVYNSYFDRNGNQADIDLRPNYITGQLPRVYSFWKGNEIVPQSTNKTTVGINGWAHLASSNAIVGVLFTPFLIPYATR